MGPVFVTAHDAHLMDVVAMLKHQTDPMMAKVVKVEVFYLQRDTSIVENLGDLLPPDGEYQITFPLLPKDNLK
jgi:hypothetical protein